MDQRNILGEPIQAEKLHQINTSLVIKGLTVSLLFCAIIFLSNNIIFPIRDAPVIWSANAIPVAILLFNHNKNWPIILFITAIVLVGGLWSEVQADHYAISQNRINQLIVIGGINLLEIFLLAKIIRKFSGRVPNRKKIRSVIITCMWALAVILIMMSILSAVIFLFLTTEMRFFNTVLRCFTSAFLGQVLLLPAILGWVVMEKYSIQEIASHKTIELAVMLVSLIFIITLTQVSLDSKAPIHFILPYLTLPLLVWSSFRFGIRITLTCAIITSLYTKYLASLGYISFGSAELSIYNQISEMNIGLIALNVTILILAIIIADQKEAKNELMIRDVWFDLAINHMSGGMYMLDQGRRFKVLSSRLIENFNLPNDVCFMGGHVETVLKYRAERGDYGPGALEDIVRKKMENLENPNTTNGQNKLPNGQTYEYFQNHTKDGEVIVIYHNITERIQAEENSKKALIEAQKASKAKTDFLANMSHELRTPLNAIIGFSEMMAKGKFAETSADKVKEYSNDIHMSGHHLLQIINDILDLSKIEAGMTDVEFETIHLGECTKECVTFLDIRADGAKITIYNEIETFATTVHADKRMFKQIMINLLSNSVKFTPEGGSINISHNINDDGEVTISVADTGIGIDPDEIKNMMEPFRQADSNLSKEFEGTGLGLPLVKSLMDLHNGKISIQSTLGVGTTVLLTFPLQP